MFYKYIELKNKENMTIRGIKNYPEQIKDEKLPTIIIVHGLSGDKTGNKFFFVKMSKFFTEKNYQVFRFDFTGSGESDGEFENMTLSSEIHDIDCIMDYVNNDETVDKNNIIIIGHSLGGLITTLKAYEFNPKKIVLLAPANDLYKTAIKLYEDQNNNVNLINFNGLKMKKDFVEDIQNYNPYEKASSYDGDVMIIWGTEDISVPKVTMENTIKSFRVPVEYIEIEGADHSFTNFETRDNIVERIYNFIK